MRSHVTNAERMTVRCGARGPADGDAAVRSTDIFNNDWLTKRSAHPFSDDPSDCIRWSASSEWDDERDGFARIGLGRGDTICAESDGNYCKCEIENPTTDHGRLLCWRSAKAVQRGILAVILAVPAISR